MLYSRSVLIVGLLTCAVVSAAWAQGFRVMEGPGMPLRMPPRMFSDGAFTICKMIYTSDRREANGYGWSTDYPYAGLNLMLRTSELTKTRISKDSRGEANYWTVRLTDTALFDCPMLVGSDVGTIALAREEVERLREYLLKGGFLWVDDFWGTRAIEQWAAAMRKVLPDYAIVDIPLDDPIRHMLFDVLHVPQVPGINFWRATGGRTDERGADSPQANFLGIADDHGRIMVAMTHNTDIGDAMERESEDPAFFARFSPEGYTVTINMVLYALAH
jgi:uncharacterized protein DUF4159